MRLYLNHLISLGIPQAWKFEHQSRLDYFDYLLWRILCRHSLLNVVNIINHQWGMLPKNFMFRCQQNNSGLLPARTDGVSFFAARSPGLSGLDTDCSSHGWDYSYSSMMTLFRKRRYASSFLILDLRWSRGIFSHASTIFSTASITNAGCSMGRKWLASLQGMTLVCGWIVKYLATPSW